MLPRAEISRRLKAARWLAGTTADAKGKPAPLSVADLVEREPLKGNRFTKNRIEEIEQTKIEARSMELEKVAEALHLPHSWFTEPDLGTLIADDATGPGEGDVDAEGRAALKDVDRRGADAAEPRQRGGRAAGP